MEKFIEEKEMLRNALEKKKEIEIEKIKKIEEKIETTNDVVDLYMYFVEIYGNTLEQSRYAIEYIKKIALDDFFIKAETNIHPNSISFENDYLKICFPTSRCKEIIVYYKNERKIERYSDRYEKYLKEILELAKKYQETKSIKVAKEFICYKISEESNAALKKYENLSIIEKIKILIKTKELTNENICNYISKIEEKLRKYLEKKEQIERNNKRYSENIEKTIVEINNLKTLRLFDDKNWKFKFINLPIEKLN